MLGGGVEKPRAYRERVRDAAAQAPLARSSSDDPPAVVIEFRAAVSLLGRFPALAGVNLRLTAGQIVLLEGPNGAGKSTLLRLCSGLAPLNRGQGIVLGRNVSSRRERRALRAEVGLLSHRTALYDELTVEENISFWARANGAEASDIGPAMDALGLSGRLGSVPVAGLSAGQRRRASMAVVLCRRPRLWLLDEPHTGLDREGRDLIDSLMRQAVSAGATVVFASHEADRAASLADTVVSVIGGQTHGPPHTVPDDVAPIAPASAEPGAAVQHDDWSAAASGPDDRGAAAARGDHGVAEGASDVE